MATHQLAQGLASLGRHGDSMLMHVSPAEVEGLSALGKMTGHKLHTNPHTGMPEAFDFGSFLASLLPTAAGFLVGGPAGAAMGLEAGTTAAAIAPVAAGMLTGAAVAGAKGEDVLTGGLMGGLGGYGGGNLGSTFGKMGAQGGYQAGQAVTQGTAQTTAAGMDALNTTNPLLGAPGTVNPALTNLASSGANAAAPMSYSQGLGQMGRGATKLISPGGYDAFKAAGGSGMQLATSIGIPALQAMQPKPIDTTDEEAKRKAEASKYVDPITGKLNPYQSRPNFGTMLMATGGAVNTNSSSISSGGIQDLYGTNDQTTGTQNLSKDGYGIGRLDNLASEGSRAKAADTFYAEGGPIAFAEGGSSDIKIPGYDGSALNVNDFSNGSGMGGDALYSINNEAAFSPVLKMLFEKMPQADRAKFIGSGIGSFFGLQERPKQEYYTSSGKLTSQYAQGGPVAFAEGGSSNIYIPGYNNPTAVSGNPLLAILAQLFGNQSLFNAQANTPAPAVKTPSAPMTIDPLNAPGMYPQAADNYMASVPTDKGTFA
jgi:hypothetical protein